MKCTKIWEKKGYLYPDPDDPPRQRANKIRGHGTWHNDRPLMCGIVGRKSDHIHLEVISNSTRDILEFNVLDSTLLGATVNTDEWEAYSHLPENNRVHVTVCHKPDRREWSPPTLPGTRLSNRVEDRG